MKKIVSIFILSVVAIFCAFNFTACGEKECKHVFTNFVSDGNATIDKDGTKTAVCNNGCGQTKTEVDVGSKLKSKVNYDFNVVNGVANVTVGNQTEEYDFETAVTVEGKYTYKISLDKYGEQVLSTKKVSLNIGNNVFYVLEMDGNKVIGKVKVEIYRNKIYTVTFEGLTETQLIEEGNLATEPTIEPTKDGYTFGGWNFNFASKISSNRNISAKWIANSGISYKVEHYKAKSDGNGYDLIETESKTGTTDEYVSAEVKELFNFMVDEELSSLSDNIIGDGSLVLKVYYRKINSLTATWTTYNGFSSTTITTSIAKNIGVEEFNVENVNKYKLTYSLDKPVKGLITIGSHTEDFFLEAGENITFTSFTDDVIGNRITLDSDRSVIHTTPYVAGSPLVENVTNGKVFSGDVSIVIEPIGDVTVNFKPISFSMGYQKIDQRVIYIANEKYKVGTHLYYGGALTYFEDLQDGDPNIGNLVNLNDGGRLIQQSYYATDSVSNGGVSYNPVQGGNGYGFSKIIDFSFTEDCIYIKARAKNWLDRTYDGLSSSYMENWYKLTDDALIVENTFVDFLLSNNGDGGHELPAAYFVGALDRLAVYTGNNPWSDEPLTYYNAENLLLQNKGGKGLTWFDDAESWGAWVNDEGWGCGVYTPNARSFGAWYYGDPSIANYSPYNTHTAYLRFSKNYPINPFEKISYSYMIATGTTDELRQLFKTNKDYDTNVLPQSFAESYDFTNIDFSIEKTLTFTQRGHNVDIAFDEGRGALKIAVTGDDPYFGISLVNSNNRPQTSEYPIVAVEYMIPEKFAEYYTNETPQIYLGVNNQDYVVGGQAKSFSVIADGKWHVAYVDFSDCEWFTGTINYIRYDSHSGSPLGTEYYVKSIKMLSEIPIDPAYADDYVPSQRNYLECKNEKDCFLFNIETVSSNAGISQLKGWILVKEGVKRYEYILFEKGSLTEEYLLSAQAEKDYQLAPCSRSDRFDAGNYFPNIGVSGANLGFVLSISENLIEDGKTYSIAIRAVTNKGNACFMGVRDFPF